MPIGYKLKTALQKGCQTTSDLTAKRKAPAHDSQSRADAPSTITFIYRGQLPRKGCFHVFSSRILFCSNFIPMDFKTS